ncbi:hypothetical protein DFS34DRAFT_219589 [Phlyctochytrium arcticum]|nr:hypothetical protein DFS34DRAFT_219589 [Phlyctochytrium arcticum]
MEPLQQHSKPVTPTATPANPFAKKSAAHDQHENELSQDMLAVRMACAALGQSKKRPSRSPGKNRNQSDVAKAETATPTASQNLSLSPQRHSSRLDNVKVAYAENDDEKQILPASNDDHCSVCLGRGRLLCCDSCPRAFHFFCVEEGFSSIEDVPPGKWECNNCRASKDEHSRRKKKLKSPSAQSSRAPESVSNIFDHLLSVLETLNPRAFELPSEIVNSFVGIRRHPGTGALIDLREVDVFRTNKQNKHTRRQTSNGLAAAELPSSESRTRSEKHVCFRCGKTGIKLASTSFLLSHSSTSTTSATPQVQSERTELIKCDYCPLYWHLDCLTPPLTTIPPELRDEETEVVDAASWNALRETTWGSDTVLDMDFSERQSKSGRSRPEMFSNTSGRSSLGAGKKTPSAENIAKLESSGTFQIRRKWMCPCHVDWSLPKLRMNSSWRWVDRDSFENVNSTSEFEPGTVVPSDRLAQASGNQALQQRNQKPRTASGKKTKAKREFPVQGYRVPHNGYIDIINDGTTDSRSSKNSRVVDGNNVYDSDTVFSVGNTKHRLPEQRVRLDFINKVRSLRDLGTARSISATGSPQPEELDQSAYSSHISELYNTAQPKLAAGDNILLYAAAVSDPKRAAAFGGNLRLSDEEITLWLESINQLQSELASILALRKAANTYKSSFIPSPSMTAQSEADGPPTSDTASSYTSECITIHRSDPLWVAFNTWKSQHTNSCPEGKHPEEGDN